MPVVLIAALLVLWSRRYERVDGEVVTLWELREVSPETREPFSWENGAFRATAGQPLAAAEFSVVLPPDCEALGIHVRVSAENLEHGARETDDGKLHIVWRDPAGHADDIPRYISSAVGTADGEIREAVWKRPVGRMAVVRVTNAGRSGNFRVKELEIRALKTSRLWKAAMVPYLVAWAGWLFWFFRTEARMAAWRAALTAGIWLFMFQDFVVPGPWAMDRPLVVDFHMPAVREGPGAQMGGAVRFVTLPEEKNGAEDPLGLILWVKKTFRSVRPALHVLFVCVPVFFTAFLVSRRRAWMMGVFFSVAVEAAQLGFGYGFDWLDVGDLLFDAVGIAFALRAHRWWMEKSVTGPFAQAPVPSGQSRLDRERPTGD